MSSTNIKTQVILEATAELKEQVERELQIEDPEYTEGNLKDLASVTKPYGD